jgi:hypothetical protein
LVKSQIVDTTVYCWLHTDAVLRLSNEIYWILNNTTRWLLSKLYTIMIIEKNNENLPALQIIQVCHKYNKLSFTVFYRLPTFLRVLTTNPCSIPTTSLMLWPHFTTKICEYFYPFQCVLHAPYVLNLINLTIFSDGIPYCSIFSVHIYNLVFWGPIGHLSNRKTNLPTHFPWNTQTLDHFRGSYIYSNATSVFIAFASIMQCLACRRGPVDLGRSRPVPRCEQPSLSVNCAVRSETINLLHKTSWRIYIYIYIYIYTYIHTWELISHFTATAGTVNRW